MSKLEVLDCTGNDSHLPPREVMPRGVRKVQKFLALQLAARNKLPPEFKVGDEEVANSVGVLDLSNWSLVHMDKSIDFIADRLDTITCNHNLMSALPRTFMSLTRITTLELGDNQFREVPLVVLELRTLTCLKMPGNLLEAIPPLIADLAALQELDMSHNHISTIPDD
eukprot:2229714-Rhodomonas_salina.1